MLKIHFHIADVSSLSASVPGSFSFFLKRSVCLLFFEAPEHCDILKSIRKLYGVVIIDKVTWWPTESDSPTLATYGYILVIDNKGLIIWKQKIFWLRLR